MPSWRERRQLYLLTYLLHGAESFLRSQEIPRILWNPTTLHMENGIILIFLGWCIYVLLKLFCFFWKCQYQYGDKWT